MSQSKGPRIVSKYVEGVSATYTNAGDTSQPAGTWAITSLTPASEWYIDPTGVLFWQGYIDLSGYRPDDMVLVPTAVQCQYGAPFLSQAAEYFEPGGPMYVQYALTTDKIDDMSFGNAGVAEPLAGYIGDNSEMDQVIYGVSEVYGPASSRFYAAQLLQRHTYGDGPAIVGPRIYVNIRIALTIPRNQANTAYSDGSYNIPPMRFVIAGNATEVPDYQLLHLMKRQVDLQQTPDVDL
tara:strand:- start:76 stop:786 length:711 start_codon:yes stop_codon:yes gene_type:complete